MFVGWTNRENHWAYGQKIKQLMIIKLRENKIYSMARQLMCSDRKKFVVVWGAKREQQSTKYKAPLINEFHVQLWMKTWSI